MNRCSGPSGSGHRPFLGIWSLLAAAGACVVLALPLLTYPYCWDQAVFGNIADTMRRGGVVYRDAWEHRPPGLFYVYYVAGTLIARDYWSIRVLEMLSLGVTSAILLHVGRSRFGSRVAGWISALALPVLYLRFGENTAQSESFQMPFLAGAWALWPLPKESENVVARTFWCGVLLSIAALLKTPAVVLFGLVFLDRLLRDVRNPGWYGKLRLSSIVAVGMLLLPLACVLYYSARGALAECVDANVSFPLRYAGFSATRPLYLHGIRIFERLKHLLPAAPALLLAAGVVRGLFVRREATVGWGCAFVGSLLVVAIQAKYFDYQFIPIVPFLAAGLGLLFCEPASSVPVRAARTLRAMAVPGLGAVLLALGTLQYAADLAPVFRRSWRLARIELPLRLPSELDRAGGEPEAALWVRSRTAENESVFVWGDRPNLYILMDRPVAGPCSHLLGMIPPWGDPARLSRVLQKVSEANPRIVIVVCDDFMWWHGKPAKELLGIYPSVQQFLTGSYDFATKIGPYEIWERHPERDAAGLSRDWARDPR